MPARARWTYVEVKYLLIGALLLGGLVALAQGDLLGGLEDQVGRALDVAARYGLVGVFVGALLANSTLLISVPYTLLVLTAALTSDSWLYMVALSIASGLGAGLGEIMSYWVAARVAAQVDALEESGLFRWMQRALADHPHFAPGLVFVGAATPLPDDLVLIPLALVNYPVRKILLPMLTGKILHSLSLVTLFIGVLDFSGMRAAPEVRIDLALGILVVSGLVMLYQVEKARLEMPAPAARAGKYQSPAPCPPPPSAAQ